MVILNRGLICSVIVHVIKGSHESLICLITNHLGVINTVKCPNDAELRSEDFLILDCFL